MENGPFENPCPIENGDIPACYVSLPEGICSPETDLFTLERPITVGTLPETRRGKKTTFQPQRTNAAFASAGYQDTPAYHREFPPCQASNKWIARKISAVEFSGPKKTSRGTTVLISSAF